MSDVYANSFLRTAEGQALGLMLDLFRRPRAPRVRPRRSRQLRSARYRQELRTWARTTGGRLAVSQSPLDIEGARMTVASLGPATVADATAFTTWLATRKRWGLVSDAVP